MSSRLIVIVIYPLSSIQSSWSIFFVCISLHSSSQHKNPSSVKDHCSAVHRCAKHRKSRVHLRDWQSKAQLCQMVQERQRVLQVSTEKVLFSKVERCSHSSDDELNRVVYLSMKLDAVQSIYMKWNPLCKWITKYLATEDVSASLALTHTVLAFFLLFFSSMRSISNANMNSNLLLLRDLLRLQRARRMQPFFVLIPFFMCTRFSLVLPPL